MDAASQISHNLWLIEIGFVQGPISPCHNHALMMDHVQFKWQPGTWQADTITPSLWEQFHWYVRRHGTLLIHYWWI
jgi:hypothetical protein